MPIGDAATAEAVRIVTEKRRNIMQQVIENLKGDALGVAMDIGIDDLFAEGGDTRLEEALMKNIFPITKHESKALYKEGHKTREGALAMARKALL